MNDTVSRDASVPVRCPRSTVRGRLGRLYAAGFALLVLGAQPAWAQKEPVEPLRGLKAEWGGWVQFGAAHTFASPSHLSQARTRAEIAGRGVFGEGVNWKLSARAHYDAVFDLGDHYPAAVRRDQRAQIALHEAYVDFSAGDWEFRLGKQNIVWGEMVGLFFADVVSAKDLREFVLPEFDQIRIPQWAARAEWFAGDTHLELIWLPVPEIDRIGKLGAEFYPFPPAYPGYGYDIAGEQQPSRKLSNSGLGFRVSTLVEGWDLAAFVYRAPDAQAYFQRSLLPGLPPTVLYEPRHDRVTRVGGTLAKDFEGIVAKAELVYTQGRRFGLATLDAGDGVVALDTVDWVAGVDATPADGWRVNAQLFQRAFLDYDARIGLRRHETGASLLVARELGPGLDAEVLGIASLNRSDWLLRATLTWKHGRHARVRGGVDVFGGEAFGLFGRFRDRDRVWAEYRYSF